MRLLNTLVLKATDGVATGIAPYGIRLRVLSNGRELAHTCSFFPRHTLSVLNSQVGGMCKLESSFKTAGVSSMTAACIISNS